MKGVVKIVQAVQVQTCGRPRCGSYRLQCILPAQVLDELVRVENETDVYRTRIAARVLEDWAEQRAFARHKSTSSS
jgi:hypothetical protein